VANGIHYLHSVCRPRIVHRDINSSHILLDQNLDAKLGGFSLAYLFTDDESVTEEVAIAGTL
jgi:serine/threonine protein kinase